MMQNMRELMRWETRITGFLCRYSRGEVRIPLPVIDYFDVPDLQLCMKVQKEILLACEPTKTSIATEFCKGKLRFPDAAIEKLGPPVEPFVGPRAIAAARAVGSAAQAQLERGRVPL